MHTVMVADDNAMQRKLLSIRLSQTGYHAIAASDGAEALEKASTIAPDLIVSDILMPRLNGYQLCQAVRRHPRLQLIPVILTSSGAIAEEDFRLARSVGANALVERTPDLAGVLTLVEQTIKQSPPPRQRDASAEKERLRADFLAAGQWDSAGILEELKAGSFEPRSIMRLLHRWAGVGTALDLPRIGQKAWEVERTIEAASPGNTVDISAKFQELAQLFSDGLRASQPASETLRLALRSLRNKRFALLGFSEDDAAPLARILSDAGGFPDVMPAGFEMNELMATAFDLFVIRLSLESDFAGSQSRLVLAATAKPILFVGARELLDRMDLGMDNPQDLLAAPWRPDAIPLQIHQLFVQARHARTAGARALEQISAVVADDDPAVVALLSTVFRKHSITCYVAHDGGEALTLTRQVLPNLLFLDANTPQVDGFRVLEALRKDERTRQVRIIMLTGRQDEQDVTRSFTLGAEDYIVKPFLADDIVSRLEGMMAGLRA